MSHRHFKWLVKAGILLASALIASVPVPAGTARRISLSGSVPTHAANSTHPAITWSAPSIAIKLAPGETASTQVTVVSSIPLSEAAIELAPEISPFVAISPGTLDAVSAGQSQNVQMTFAIPPGTPLTTFEGTIHVRAGNATVAQPLKITITTGLSFSTSAYSLQYPADWIMATTLDEIGFIPPAKQVNPDSEYIGDVVIETFPKAAEIDLRGFYSQGTIVDLFANSQTQTSLTINGVSAVRFTSVAGMIPTDIVAIDKGTVVVELSDVGQLHQTDGIFDLMVQSVH